MKLVRTHFIFFFITKTRWIDFTAFFPVTIYICNILCKIILYSYYYFHFVLKCIIAISDHYAVTPFCIGNVSFIIEKMPINSLKLIYFRIAEFLNVFNANLLYFTINEDHLAS